MRRLPVLTAALLLAGACLASTAARADDADSAAPDTKAALIDPSSFPTDLDGEIHRVQVLRANGNLKDAAHSLAQMMLVAPDDPRVVGEYGKVLVLENRPEDATAFLKRAIELQSGEWSFYSALGVALDEQGDRKNAKSAYQRALVLNPGEPSVLNNFAMSRKAAGDLVSARKLITEAQASGAGDETIARNFALLLPSKADNTAAAQASVAQAGAPQKASAVQSAAPVAAHAPEKVSSVQPPAAETTPAPTAQVASIGSVTTAPLDAASASAAPRQIGVVMQRVPVDPLAGPVGKTHRGKLAAHAGAAHKPAVATKKPATPTLRMSADAS